ncbi:hypothetical protein [Geothrix limicola]|uniref:hypothetical protein n=1 Tax=Geothrix limicola TaxID=2927978 RepID=UPI002553EFE5|nr:hypothetical protein [Geothrix limicola]
MTEQEIVIKAMQLLRQWHAKEFRTIETNEQFSSLFPLFQEAWKHGLVQNQRLSGPNFTEAISVQWFANDPTSNVDHDWNSLYEPILTVWKAWSFMAAHQ